MRISKLIKELNRYKRMRGDVDLSIDGYPGDYKVSVIDCYPISARAANPHLPYDLIFEKIN